MITMQEAEMRMMLKRFLRRWEHEHNRILAPSDVRFLAAWVDEYCKKNFLKEEIEG